MYFRRVGRKRDINHRFRTDRADSPQIHRMYTKGAEFAFSFYAGRICIYNGLCASSRYLTSPFSMAIAASFSLNATSISHSVGVGWARFRLVVFNEVYGRLFFRCDKIAMRSFLIRFSSHRRNPYCAHIKCAFSLNAGGIIRRGNIQGASEKTTPPSENPRNDICKINTYLPFYG